MILEFDLWFIAIINIYLSTILYFSILHKMRSNNKLFNCLLFFDDMQQFAFVKSNCKPSK